MELLLTASNSEIKGSHGAALPDHDPGGGASVRCGRPRYHPALQPHHPPLQQLTQAARKIALGDLDVELPQPTHDEVGILTRAFEVTVSNLRQYLDNMRDMAFTDPLTHVKNKTAYNHSILRLQDGYGAGPGSVRHCDVRPQRPQGINDRYGHERGDEYIVNCCRLICRVFKRSSIFRIGGDEFVALLKGPISDAGTTWCAQLKQRDQKRPS